MIRTENINFVASKYAPNPKEVTYWVDLSADQNGNTIKTYNYDQKEWIPINNDTNSDQGQKIKQIVDSVGLIHNQVNDKIQLPIMDDNRYFKGRDIVSAIAEGDKKINAYLNQVDTFVNNVNAVVGSPNGFATLNESGKVPESQLPSYVDDVLEFNSINSFPNPGESGKIYVDTTTNLTYRWSGSTYVEIGQGIALGETSSTAYAGNKGKANAAAIVELQNNKISGVGVTNIQVVTTLPEIPDATTLYIVIEEETM